MKFEGNILVKEINRMAKGIEIECGVQCELTYTPDYPPLYNNPELTALVAESLRNIDGDEDIKEIKEFPALAPSEDFAYYAEKFPACFFFIACSPKGVSEP
ncbi:M20/M25/M40 family metallo-hydrolase [Heyndrickxia oleronia]|jgi:metal-dependent amidase/aminoacylase/carboxypeptidase family protein|uniref:M20/M25/M40 family metallo-hydrolase n=2 Tax=Heyndrickxia oleronia TaxID=38875 RepID=UPI0024682ECB|nr:M20/M25/M40 family metallo-hydrolase [Heyndrickxia oleronia]